MTGLPRIARRAVAESTARLLAATSVGATLVAVVTPTVASAAAANHANATHAPRTAAFVEAIGVAFERESLAAAACTRNWDGGASTMSWNDAANWDPDGVPTPTDVACIGSGFTVEHSAAVTDSVMGCRAAAR
jgi:hypothetical protein